MTASTISSEGGAAAVTAITKSGQDERNLRLEQKYVREVYRAVDGEVLENKEEWEAKHPPNTVDHRPAGGPLLTYLWPENDDGSKAPLSGQTLYLGGEVGCDGNIYYIPGHAPRVLKVDTVTDKVTLIGPTLPGKYKWLRGVPVRNDTVIYGLPCHADSLLRIDVVTGTVTTIPIPYDEFYKDDPVLAKQQRAQEWKYHGGSISPVDGCIYAIPQSALHVLQVDPVTETCRLVGPLLPGKYKWYGGLIADAVRDKAIYGIPHDSQHVLRILPTGPKNAGTDAEVSITLHGNYPLGGHKWHGAGASSNGTIVCVPANADTVLCITPTSCLDKTNSVDGTATTSDSDSVVVLTELGDATSVQSGRHRKDRKYKFLGATGAKNGKVYLFPCASEHVLACDGKTIENLEPNLYDAGLERLCQNKWQNGVLSVLGDTSYVYGIPLAAESLLRIDCREGPQEEQQQQPVTTWSLPSPCRCLAKFEGAVVAPTGVIYTVPNCFKAVLRIEPANLNVTPLPQEVSPTSSSPADVDVDVARVEEEVTENDITLSNEPSPPQESQQQQQQGKVPPRLFRDDFAARDTVGLIYKSGIPTLRSSAHRVKFSPKSRLHDPNPKNRQGEDTGTMWLPDELCQEYIFQYDESHYQLQEALKLLLRQCDANIVGSFREGSDRLEDFVVPSSSVWRSCNGGQCETAQKYLSDKVIHDEGFLKAFDRLLREVVLPNLKARLVAVGAASPDEGSLTFYYQRPPTIRFQPGPAWAAVKPHDDAEYGHQNGELNFWVPFTDRTLTGVDLWAESKSRSEDYHPIPAKPGEIISFHGSSCRHYVNTNTTEYTRVSMDFRVGVEGFFDPFWQMRGTTDDHGRQELRL